MKKFDVFQLPDGSYRAIKHGFNWPSFFFNWIWCFFIARLYGWGCVWLGVLIVSKVFDKIADEPNPSGAAVLVLIVTGLLFLGFGIWFSFNANEFRRRKYSQLGYSLVRKKFDASSQDNAISIARQENKPIRNNFSQTSPKAKDVVQPRQTSQTEIYSSPEAENTLPSEKTDLSKEKKIEVTEEKPQKSSDKPGWSEEFCILFEYDSIVKECHDELDGISPQLSNKFRDEVVSDRKKAAETRDRLKAEHEKKLNPYPSEKLNEGLSEARMLGPKAEEEYVRVVEVMGEDIEVDGVISRLKEKYGPEQLKKIILNFSISEASDDELVMAIEDFLDDRLLPIQMSRLEGIKIILLGRKLKLTERSSLESMYTNLRDAALKDATMRDTT